jgi:hypothetical protein
MAYLDHPAEEVLERFLLSHCSENELCEVETHILHCEGCVARLELLELQITAFKLCLQMMLNRQLTMATRESDRIHELV